jgi:hypothetical protein
MDASLPAVINHHNTKIVADVEERGMFCYY